VAVENAREVSEAMVVAGLKPLASAPSQHGSPRPALDASTSSEVAAVKQKSRELESRSHRGRASGPLAPTWRQHPSKRKSERLDQATWEIPVIASVKKAI